MTISKEQKELIKRTIMPNSSDDELELFVSLANRYDLDPFARQMSAQPFLNKKTGQTKWNFSIDRDGYLRIANRNPNFLGIVSASIYEKDTFEADIGAGYVKHIVKIPRGNLIGAWAKAQTYNPNAKCPNLLLISVDTISNHMNEIKENSAVNFWRDETEKMLIKEVEKMVLKKVVPIEEKRPDDIIKPEDIQLITNGNPEMMEIPDIEIPELPDQKPDLKTVNTTPEIPIKSIETKTMELPTIDLPALDLNEIKPVEEKPKETEPEPKSISKKKTSKKEIKEPEKPAEKKEEKPVVEIHYASDEEPSVNDFPTQTLFAVIEESFKASPDLINMIEKSYKSNVQKKPKAQTCLFYALTIVKNNLETQQITDINWYEKFQSRMTRIINQIKTDVVPMLKPEQTELQQRDIIQKITGYDDFQIEWVLRFVKTL